MKCDQNQEKKSSLWIILLIVIALLTATGIALAAYFIRKK